MRISPGDHAVIHTKEMGDETIAGLGVGGSPGGDKDEVCAQAGVAKAAELLKK